MAIRAAVLVPPTHCFTGTTVLPTPGAGRKWKVSNVLVQNIGATQGNLTFELGATALTRQDIWTVLGLNAQNSVSPPMEGLVILSTQSFAARVSALDDMVVTISGYDLPA